MVYWIESSGAVKLVKRSVPAPLAATEDLTTAIGLNSFTGDDQHLYVVDNNKKLVAIAKATGTIAEIGALDTSNTNDFGSMANDDSHVYWSTGLNVFRLAKNGGVVETLETHSQGLTPPPRLRSQKTSYSRASIACGQSRRSVDLR